LKKVYVHIFSHYNTKNKRCQKVTRMKKKKIVVVIQFDNGFPNKRTIVCLLNALKIESDFFQFIQHEDGFDFGVQRIIWKSKKLEKSMKSFVKFLEFNQIQVKSVKIDTSKFNCIWFQQKNQ
jgi:hypothetical protein